MSSAQWPSYLTINFLKFFNAFYLYRTGLDRSANGDNALFRIHPNPLWNKGDGLLWKRYRAIHYLYHSRINGNLAFRANFVELKIKIHQVVFIGIHLQFYFAKRPILYPCILCQHIVWIWNIPQVGRQRTPPKWARNQLPLWIIPCDTIASHNLLSTLV